jgi:hypothetical protein
MASLPEIIDPDWVAQQMAAVADIGDDSNARLAHRYLKDLVLFRIAHGGIIDKEVCAAALRPEDRSFSWGW